MALRPLIVRKTQHLGFSESSRNCIAKSNDQIFSTIHHCPFSNTHTSSMPVSILVLRKFGMRGSLSSLIRATDEPTRSQLSAPQP